MFISLVLVLTYFVLTDKILVPEETKILPLSLLLNILCVNLFFNVVTLRAWQIALSSESLKEATLGTWQGVVWLILVSLVFFVLGYIFPSSVNVAFESFINQLSDFTLLLALFTCGCLSALISTADSAILAILHNVVSENGWRRALRLWLIGLFTLVILSYYLVFKGLKYDFTTWLFTIFSLSVISGPMILLAVFTETNIL